MLEYAVRICDATFGNIYRWDGEALHIVATHYTPPAFAEALRRSPYRPDPKNPIGHMVATKTLLHVRDVAAEILTPTIRWLFQRSHLAVYERFWPFHC